ncbi:CheY-like chemotaxis protein [Deinococcus humi]|uniref:CheY-like chemotaxis protein n=2 Tax=Deinococcus humi TaxID=662880 RepID=A0A7W8JZ40_9DEIO|nr:CheY-like chemotaxis protein [Deinococcus humi]
MMRVLLIEDHPADVLLLQASLELIGLEWTLDDAPTFAEAARRWPGGNFGMLVLDLNLPDGHGLELLARALELASGTPVVVLSGLANREVAAQAVGLGARAYVIKGLDAAEELQQIVAQFA